MNPPLGAWGALVQRQRCRLDQPSILLLGRAIMLFWQLKDTLDLASRYSANLRIWFCASVTRMPWRSNALAGVWLECLGGSMMRKHLARCGSPVAEQGGAQWRAPDRNKQSRSIAGYSWFVMRLPKTRRDHRWSRSPRIPRRIRTSASCCILTKLRLCCGSRKPAWWCGHWPLENSPLRLSRPKMGARPPRQWELSRWLRVIERRHWHKQSAAGADPRVISAASAASASSATSAASAIR